MSGPLAEFAVGFAGRLAALGYSPRGGEAQLRVMKSLSVWLAAEGFSVADLSGEGVARFVDVRRARYASFRSERALAPLLSFLRELGVVPVAPVVTPTDEVDVLLGRFAEYLRTQRGLAPATVASYVSQARPFLTWHDGLHDPRWESLTAAQVDRFVVTRAVGQRPRSVQVGLTAVRALLRWMCLEAMAPPGLTDMIGSVAAWTATTPPKALTLGQVDDLLTGLSADAVARCRDEAMLALMWRMGLRAGEVASLRLDDIDWRTGVVVVHGKGDRSEPVPLPVDVGELLVAYLQCARPEGVDRRQVFLAIDAPHQRLGAAAVSSVATRAAARGNVPPPCAAHRLRHTAASQVLARGGGLVEAGQLLRHATAAATAVYARCDLVALSLLVRPWPMPVTTS
ncbi:MAG TPA: tyrosine-type recombinase/integrase [Kineosporiaceae bacterium]|nr:tyrosine-type recombinase/integrase [Kineosporiaceae bacterium]